MIKSIGEFQVKAELGRGGMGRVYRAYDPRLDHEVAIKVLTSDGDPDLLRRFRTEAGTTARLRHPNIVTVHAYGEQDGMPYLVMELLEGLDLGRVIRDKTPLTLLDKVRIMHQVAAGLSYAHQQKVVHRDIKPGNIMLLPDGSAKIMDFGIARVTGGDATRRTQKGFIIGTIGYMAPEQFKAGKDADPLTDIFAFGDVLYELISGIQPFQADDPGTQIFRITSVEPPSLQAICPDCPDSLAYIVQQLLSKDRDLRYQSLHDVILDLEPLLFQLREQRAGQILEEAHALIAGGKIEEALDKTKQALGVDPVNREAQKVRNELQKQLQLISVRSKVEALLAEAGKLVAERKMAEALPLLEDAFRLDKSGVVQQRLDSVRAEQEKIQRAGVLLAEARREVQKGNLPLAEHKVAQALGSDPFNTEAGRLAKRIRESIERLERERRIREAVQSSAVLASNHDFAGALQVLDEAAQALGNEEELDTVRTRILGLKADFDWKERQKRFDLDLTNARTLLGADQLPEARAALDLIAVEYSDWPSLSQGTSGLRAELLLRERKAEVARIQRLVATLVEQWEFVEARAQLDDGLRRFANDPVLRRSLDELLRAKSARDRAVVLAIETIARLRRQDLNQAVEAARTAQRDFPERAEFTILAAELQQEIEGRQRQIQVALEKARPLIASDPRAAADLLRGTLRQTGQHAGLEQMLRLADQAVLERKELLEVQGILVKAQELTLAQQWNKAQQELERGLTLFPRRRELLEAAAEVRAELERLARAARLSAQTRAIVKALDRREWPKAAALLDAFRAEFPAEPRSEQLAEELRRERRIDEFAAFAASFRECLSRDDLQAAQNLLASQSGNFGAEPGWPALLMDCDQRGSYLFDLAEARRLGGAGQFDEADRHAQSALLNVARDSRAGDLSQLLAQQRAKAEAEAREVARVERVRQEAEAREAARIEAEAREAARVEQERKEAEAGEAARVEQERKDAEAREAARVEQERKEAEAREAARVEQERKDVEAREAARVEQERKDVEAREAARVEQERKEAEAREAARVEQERKDAEAREATRVEQERKEAEAREAARVEQERKQAEAREAARVEQERKQAEAREAARVEQERKQAEAREAARVEQERKDAEAREATRVEQERKEAEARDAARVEQERKDVEAREAAGVEQARKEAEAREVARVEQERKEAEAARKKSKRKEAEAREATRKDQKRRDAEAREATRREQERRAAVRKESEVHQPASEQQDDFSSPDLAVTRQQPIPHRPAAETTVLSDPNPAVPAANSGLETARLTLPETRIPPFDRVIAQNDSLGPVPHPAPWATPKGKVVIGVIAAGALGIALIIFRTQPVAERETPAATPAKVELTYLVGAGAGPSAEVAIRGIHVPFEAASTARWLAVDPVAGQALGKLALHVLPKDLGPSSYEGEIRLSPSDPHQLFSSIAIPVHLEVLGNVPKGHPPPPALRLGVQPASLSFGYRDGSVPPNARLLSVQGGDRATIWEASIENPRDSAWLVTSRAPKGLIVSIRPTGLNAGRHVAMLLISAAGVPAVRVPISLSITSGGSVAVPQPGAQELIRWRGELLPGQALTIQLASASLGSLAAGELPAAPIEIDPSGLGTLVIESRPSARNNYKLQLRNRGTDTVRRFTFYFRVLN